MLTKPHTLIFYLLILTSFSCGSTAGLIRPSCSSWQQIYIKQSMDQVKSILGKPRSVKRWSGQETWNYANGSVTFYSGGKVWSYNGPNCNYSSKKPRTSNSTPSKSTYSKPSYSRSKYQEMKNLVEEFDVFGEKKESDDNQTYHSGRLSRAVQKRVYPKDLSIEGKVTYNVCINRAGEVIYLKMDKSRSTITDSETLVDISYAMLKTTFSKDDSALEQECGTWSLNIKNPN